MKVIFNNGLAIIAVIIWYQIVQSVCTCFYFEEFSSLFYYSYRKHFKDA